MSNRKHKKTHVLINRQLLQINKRFSDLKMNQKNSIAEWFYQEYENFYRINNKLPTSKKDKITIINAVYNKIREHNIWIPYNEIKWYFYSKQARYKKHIMKLNQNEVNFYIKNL